MLNEQGWHGEAWTTHRALPELRTGAVRIAELRDKSFRSDDTTDDDVIAYAEDCGELARIVNMADCMSVTDATMESLAANCANLRSLDLNWCHLVTDKGVISVAKCCTQLTSLNIYGCTTVTQKGLVAVVEGCSELTSIKLGTNHATDEGLRVRARGVMPPAHVAHALE